MRKGWSVPLIFVAVLGVTAASAQTCDENEIWVPVAFGLRGEGYCSPTTGDDYTPPSAANSCDSEGDCIAYSAAFCHGQPQSACGQAPVAYYYYMLHVCTVACETNFPPGMECARETNTCTNW